MKNLTLIAMAVLLVGALIVPAAFAGGACKGPASSCTNKCPMAQSAFHCKADGDECATVAPCCAKAAVKKVKENLDKF